MPSTLSAADRSAIADTVSRVAHVRFLAFPDARSGLSASGDLPAIAAKLRLTAKHSARAVAADSTPQARRPALLAMLAAALPLAYAIDEAEAGRLRGDALGVLLSAARAACRTVGPTPDRPAVGSDHLADEARYSAVRHHVPAALDALGWTSTAETLRGCDAGHDAARVRKVADRGAGFAPDDFATRSLVWCAEALEEMERHSIVNPAAAALAAVHAARHAATVCRTVQRDGVTIANRAAAEARRDAEAADRQAARDAAAQPVG